MSAKRTERLLTLVMLLLSNPRGWTKEELFREIELYAQAPTAAAREKLFDRDKATLREQGIPVESFSDDPFFDRDSTTTRYRINAEDYRLPGMSFTPPEAAALTVAAGMWAEASLGSAASRALRKLQGMGVGGADFVPAAPIDARIRTNEPFWDELWQATTARRVVKFGYRAASTGDERERTVQPWGMGTRFGHWYLVGYDVGRQAERWFRLSRITTTPRWTAGSYTTPAGFSMSTSLASLPTREADDRAVVEIRPGTCHILRTRPGAVVSAGSEHRDIVEYSYADQSSAAAEIASLGERALVVSPDSLVREVRRRLEGAVRAMSAEPPSFSLTEEAAAAPVRESNTAEHRLLRLLDLVPYLLNHPGVEVTEAARTFGVSPAQLVKDVELLFVSGPRFYPDGLIDIQLENNRILISDAQLLGEPIRFGLDEVCALLVGLDALSNVPGLPDHAAVRSARAKLREAAGAPGEVNSSIAAVIAEDELTPVLAAVRNGIEQRRQLKLRYVVPARDEVTDRFVEPLRTFLQNDTWYLDAWCHRARGRRSFRLDRMRSVELTDRPTTAEIPPDETPAKVFDSSNAAEQVVLVLEQNAEWMAHSYAAERTGPTGDGRLAAEIRVATAAWLPGLVAGMGGDVIVVEPSAINAACLDFATDALAQYTERPAP